MCVCVCANRKPIPALGGFGKRAGCQQPRTCDDACVAMVCLVKITDTRFAPANVWRPWQLPRLGGGECVCVRV